MDIDLMILKEAEFTKLQYENDKLKNTIFWLQIGIVILSISCMILIGVVSFTANKAGYEEAAMDFYHGKMKIDIIDEKVIWR